MMLTCNNHAYLISFIDWIVLEYQSNFYFLSAVSKSSFVYQFCIGKGGFGKVWKVDRKKSKMEYAMKEMSKARILTKRSVKSVMNERQILTQLHNPFLVNMYYAF